jgi:hypothetical protein
MIAANLGYAPPATAATFRPLLCPFYALSAGGPCPIYVGQIQVSTVDPSYVLVDSAQADTTGNQAADDNPAIFRAMGATYAVVAGPAHLLGVASVGYPIPCGAAPSAVLTAWGLSPPSCPNAGASSGDFVAFAEPWGQHSGALTISADGHGEYRYRNYRLCTQDATPPCEYPGNTNSTVIETFTLTSVRGLIAYGHLDTSNDIKADKPGAPLTLTRTAPYEIELTSPGLPGGGDPLPPHTTAFCSPAAPTGLCGA